MGRCPVSMFGRGIKAPFYKCFLVWSGVADRRLNVWLMVEHEFTNLNTARLIVRRFEDRDVEAFWRLRNDPEVARHQGWPFPYSESEAASFVEAMAREPVIVKGEWFQFVIEHGSDAVLIGDIGVRADSLTGKEVEIGYSLDPAYQGQGLMGEALTALFTYLFEVLGKKRLVAVTHAINDKSCRLLQRLHFTLEGTLGNIDPNDPEAERVYALESQNYVLERRP